MRIGGGKDVTDVVALFPFRRRRVVDGSRQVFRQAAACPVVNRTRAVGKQLAFNLHNQFRGMVGRECLVIVINGRAAVDPDTGRLAVEFYEEAPDKGIAADISKRSLHRIAVVFGKFDRPRRNDLDEPGHTGAHAAIGIVPE